MENIISEVISQRLPDNAVSKLWYDWFCSDKALLRKGRALLSRVKTVSRNTKKFNTANTYVFFKNNSPCYGDWKLYDDFRICDKVSGDVLYTVIPKDPFGKAVVYGKENNFETPLISGTWNDVKKFFKE